MDGWCKFDRFCGKSDGVMVGWMDGVSLRCSFCGKSDVWMDGWMVNVRFRYRKDGWKDG